jgi:CRP-like cAMP-binding protein/uncharacterized protein YciI
MHLFLWQDPYVKAILLPNRTVHARTKHATMGGRNPVWNRSLDNKLTLVAAKADEAVELQVWNANTLNDDLIGTVEVKLTNEINGKKHSVELNSGGRLNICVTFGKKAMLRKRSTYTSLLTHKTLIIEVLEASGIRDISRLHQQDPYVMCSLLPSRTVQRTKAVTMGGTSPKWSRMQGNLISLPISPNDEQLLIEVWNENLVNDELIGSVEFPLTETALKLNCTSKLRLDTGGELDCTITMAATQSRDMIGKTIMAEIHRAENLQNTNTLTQMDPYASITMLPSQTEIKRTDYVSGGGGFPVWEGEGVKNSMQATVARGDSAMLLELWNASVVGDDYIGSTIIGLTDKELNPGEKTWRNLSADGQKGRLECTITVMDAPDKLQLTGRAVSLEVHCAKCLQNVQLFGTQDPYVIAWLLPSRRVCARTKYAYAGGVGPVWGKDDDNHLSLSLCAEDESLLLEVWNENSVQDDLIGSVEVELPSIGTTGERSMYQLDSGGTLECTIDNIEADDDAPGQDDIAEAQLLAAMREKNKARGAVILADESTHIDADNDFEPELIEKSSDQVATIRRAISDHFLFIDLETDEMEGVVGAFSQRQCKSGEEIITQGITGEDQSMYVVGEGTYDVFVDGQKVAALGPGRFFGELSLVHNCPRNATVTSSSEDGMLWQLDRKTFRHVIASKSMKSKATAVTYLRDVQILSGLSDEQIMKVAEVVQHVDYRPEDTIISKGAIGHVFYIIEAGTVLCKDMGVDSTDEVIKLGAGEYFGERALMTDEPRQANVIAETEVRCMVLDRHAFTELLGPLHDVLDMNVGISVLQGVRILEKLTEDERKMLMEEFTLETFAKGTAIITEGEEGSKFYIVKTGKAVVAQKKSEGAADAEEEVVAELSAGNYFGELALLNENAACNATVRAKTKVDCFALERDSFNRLLGPLADIMQSEGKRRASISVSSLPSAQTIKFEDLTVLRTLGTGMFGRVKLVQDTKTSSVYALKILQKAQIVAYQQQKNVVQEKNVMQIVDHPFVLKLCGTFKDKNCLYMLLELVQGGELFTFLRNRPGSKVNKEDAVFFAACVLSGKFLAAPLEHRQLSCCASA